jgi:hypothetical protein
MSKVKGQSYNILQVECQLARCYIDYIKPLRGRTNPVWQGSLGETANETERRSELVVPQARLVIAEYPALDAGLDGGSYLRNYPSLSKQLADERAKAGATAEPSTGTCEVASLKKD